MLVDIGLLILRLAIGLTFIGHGAQKLLGWFGGEGMKGMQTATVRLGFRPVWFWAPVAAWSEFGGGVLVTLGLLSPIGSLGIIAAMLVAVFVVHWRNGFWSMKRGIEYPLVCLLVALALGMLGPGAWSLDALLGITLPQPWTLGIGLIVVVLGMIAALVNRTPQPAQTPPTPGAGQTTPAQHNN